MHPLSPGVKGQFNFVVAPEHLAQRLKDPLLQFRKTRQQPRLRLSKTEPPHRNRRRLELRLLADWGALSIASRFVLLCHRVSLAIV